MNKKLFHQLKSPMFFLITYTFVCSASEQKPKKEIFAKQQELYILFLLKYGYFLFIHKIIHILLCFILPSCFIRDLSPIVKSPKSKYIGTDQINNSKPTNQSNSPAVSRNDYQDSNSSGKLQFKGLNTLNRKERKKC